MGSPHLQRAGGFGDTDASLSEAQRSPLDFRGEASFEPPPPLPISMLASPYLASACFGPNTSPMKRPAIAGAAREQHALDRTMAAAPVDRARNPFLPSSGEASQAAHVAEVAPRVKTGATSRCGPAMNCLSMAHVLASSANSTHIGRIVGTPVCSARWKSVYQ